MYYLCFYVFFPLKMKEQCNLKVEEEVFVEAKNGDASLISISMAEEEEKLLKSRMKEEEIEKAAAEEAQLDESQFNRLDQLLTQTQLYSEFLLEKIDQITAVCVYLLKCLFFPMNFLLCSFFVFVFLLYDLDCITRMERSKRVNLPSRKREVVDQKEKPLRNTIL